MNRHTSIALCVLLLAASGGLALQAHLERSQQPEPITEGWYPTSKQHKPTNATAQHVKSNPSAYERADEKDRGQIPSNLPLYGQIFIAAIGAWITWLMYGVYDRQREIMSGQLKAAEGAALAAIAAQRAWIKLDVALASDLSDDGSGKRAEFKIMVKNIGHSPATDVTARLAMFCGGKAALPIATVIDKIPDPIISPPFYTAVSLFPDGGNNLERFGRLEPAEIDAALADTFIQGRVFIYVVASVDYKFAGGSGRTSRRYDLKSTKAGIFGTVDIRKASIAMTELEMPQVPEEDIAV